MGWGRDKVSVKGWPFIETLLVLPLPNALVWFIIAQRWP
jgi:hypothetical protein